MNTENEAEVTKDGALATVLAIDAALEAGIAAADIAAVLEVSHYRSVPELVFIDPKDAVTSDYVVEFHQAGTLFGTNADGSYSYNRAGWFVASAHERPRPVPRQVLVAVAQLERATTLANNDE